MSETHSRWRASADVTDQPLPAMLRWIAIGLNALLFLTEVLYLIPRAGVRDNEVLAVSLLVATPVVSMAMFLDYYRRGVWTEHQKTVLKGHPGPLPTPVRWLVIGMNVLLLFSETVLLLQRGINLWNLELLVVSLWVMTPIVSLWIFLDYNRRRL